MDYEKLYKEALERARQFSKKPYLEDSKDIVEYIFPELKESEDGEKIRKVLIKGFQHYDKECKWGEFTTTEILAWLEKQGEKKLADKVEPKFKVGDWIVRDDHLIIGKVISFDGRHYWYNDIKCSCRVKQPLFVNDEDRYYHIWTIQDAKDGDVLSWDDSKCIDLFKSIYNEESIISHGFVRHFTGTFEAVESCHDIKGAHPATKEQRDILFQKMKEAGYEWDTEKKELKRIEQKTIWSEEDEKFLTTALWHISNSVSNGENTECHCDTIEWLKSLKYRMQQPKSE